MSIRAFIDAIFAIIGAPSLTDSEFIALTIEAADYDVATFTALLAVLDGRELVSNTRDRLSFYFLSRGVEVQVTPVAVSKIFLGSVLCGN